MAKASTLSKKKMEETFVNGIWKRMPSGYFSNEKLILDVDLNIIF